MDNRRTLVAILEALRHIADNNQAWHGFRELAAGESTSIDEGGYYGIYANGGAVVLDVSASTAAQGDLPAADVTIADGKMIVGNWSTVASDATSTGTMWVYIRDPKAAQIGEVLGRS